MARRVTIQKSADDLQVHKETSDILYIYTKDSFNLVKYFAINQSHKNNANLNTVYVFYEKKLEWKGELY